MILMPPLFFLLQLISDDSTLERNPTDAIRSVLGEVLLQRGRTLLISV